MLPLSFTRIPFGKYEGEVFDEVPLGYLDWLVGQDWLYGDFKKRLVLYITRGSWTDSEGRHHPGVIQRELEELFPDPEDDSRRPLFCISDPGPISCKIDCPQRHRWHGQGMPKGEEWPADFIPRRMRTWEAWSIATDALCVFENDAASLDDFLKIDFDQLKQAVKLLPETVAERLRTAFRVWHDNVRMSSFTEEVPEPTVRWLSPYRLTRSPRKESTHA